MKVKDLMHKNLFTFDADQTVADAARYMTEKKIGAVLVTDHTRINGIITANDFVRKVIAAGRNPEKTAVREVMSHPLIMIDSEADILRAAELMSEYDIKRIAIVEDGDIVGIFSMTLLGKKIKDIIKQGTKK